jgi:hypothetical protein
MAKIYRQDKTNQVKCLFFMAAWLISFNLAEAQTPDSATTRKDSTQQQTLVSQQAPPPTETIDVVGKPAAATDHMYHVNFLTTGIFSLAATAANIWAIPNIIHGKKDMTQQQLDALNANNVSSFDRWALTQDASKRDPYYKASDLALPGIVASAGFLMFDKNVRNDWQRIAMMYYEMHAITFAIYDFSPLGPAFQNRVRPFSYYKNDFSAADRLTGNNKNSTYSGHVASATAATFFMVKVLSDYHPEMGAKKYLYYALASVPPLALGYLRIKALAHFPTDILEGYAIGAICGIVVPQLHKNKERAVNVGLSLSSQATQVSLTWHPGTQKKLLKPASF